MPALFSSTQAYSPMTCEDIVQKLSGFDGCSVPDWMPKELVATHGNNLVDSLTRYVLRSEKSRSENYAQMFETDCNKRDICYDCVSSYHLFAQ